jgi:hypothetical protein
LNEVEFVRASGRTQALVELTLADVRVIEDEDLMAIIGAIASCRTPRVAARRGTAVREEMPT